MWAKKGDIDLSLETVIGLVLAAIAIVAILTLIVGLFRIFTQRDEGTTIEEKFIAFANKLESMGAPDGTTEPLQLYSDVAIVGFSQNAKTLDGTCGEPTLPRTIDLLITRDPIKCPLESSCLCLCKAQKISWVPWNSGRDEYINCNNAMCRLYSGDKIVNFGTVSGCSIPIMFNDGPTTVYIKKEGNNIVHFSKQPIKGLFEGGTSGGGGAEATY